MPFPSFELLDHSKPIVVFGRDGQVGKALQEFLKDSRVPVVFLGRTDCDLSDEASITQALNRYQPQVIINAAAYTTVDKAEIEQNLAFAINAHAPKVMAQFVVNQAHGVFVHYSTDYVFADTKETAYTETDVTGPVDQLCVYGQSKLTGEEAIKEAFKLSQNKSARYFILRTSWVYGFGENFIRTILHLAGELDQLKVVVDQVGVPTSATWLAQVGIRMTESGADSGIYHAVPDGETSIHNLAVSVIQTAIECGKDVQVSLESILPISTQDYPLLAKRPLNSRLNNQKLRKVLARIGCIKHYPSWREQVDDYVKNCVVTS